MVSGERPSQQLEYGPVAKHHAGVARQRRQCARRRAHIDGGAWFGTEPQRAGLPFGGDAAEEDRGQFGVGGCVVGDPAVGQRADTRGHQGAGQRRPDPDGNLVADRLLAGPGVNHQVHQLGLGIGERDLRLYVDPGYLRRAAGEPALRG